MANTKDMRTLREYKEHFRKYGTIVQNPTNSSNDTIGIIRTVDKHLVFVPLLYRGIKIYEIDIRR